MLNQSRSQAVEYATTEEQEEMGRDLTLLR